MASYSRVSLPVLPSPPPKRFRSLSPAFLSASKHSGLQHALYSAENGRPGSLRSVSSNGRKEIVVPRSVPVRVAHELLQAGYRYLDVRTVDEFNAGHAVGAKSIPYILKVGSGMTKNSNFLRDVLEVFRKDDDIIIGCQNGRRSLMAATELSSAGFTGITDIEGGYSAWVQNGLPSEQ